MDKQLYLWMYSCSIYVYLMNAQIYLWMKSSIYGCTDISMDEQIYVRMHSSLLDISMDAQQYLLMNSSIYRCTSVLSMDAQLHLLMHICSIYGCKVPSIDAHLFYLWMHSSILGCTILSVDAQLYLWMHRHIYGCTSLLSMDTHLFYLLCKLMPSCSNIFFSIRNFRVDSSTTENRPEGLTSCSSVAAAVLGLIVEEEA